MSFIVSPAVPSLVSSFRSLIRTLLEPSELSLAVSTYKISRKTLKDMVIAGFKRSFFHGPYTAKRAYVRRIFDYYEKLEAKFFA